MGALEGVGSLRRGSEGLPMGWGALLGVVLLAGGSGGLQRWAHQPPYTEANPGEEVLMPCIVQNIQVDCNNQTSTIDNFPAYRSH